MKANRVIARLERVAIVIQHAEVFSDEANDAGLYDVSDRLRLEAAQLAIELEEAEARMDAVDAARRVRHEQIVRLRQVVARLEIEMEARLPAEVAASLVAGARVSAESATRFRLRRLTAEQRAVLGDVVGECEAALARVEAAEDAALDATAAAFVARVRVIGHAHALRQELERAKAQLMAVLPIDCDAARRVRRRVVRTRRPESFGRRGDKR